jgi:hypothetical protein
MQATKIWKTVTRDTVDFLDELAQVRHDLPSSNDFLTIRVEEVLCLQSEDFENSM